MVWRCPDGAVLGLHGLDQVRDVVGLTRYGSRLFHPASKILLRHPVPFRGGLEAGEFLRARGAGKTYFVAVPADKLLLVPSKYMDKNIQIRTLGNS